MSRAFPIESLLRPAVEFQVTIAAWGAALLALFAPGLLMMTPSVADGAALVLLLYGLWWAFKGTRIVRYRRALRRVPRYRLTPDEVPVSTRSLFLGRGFEWTQRHTQRLWDVSRPTAADYLKPALLFRWARALEAHVPVLEPWLGANARITLSAVLLLSAPLVALTFAGLIGFAVPHAALAMGLSGLLIPLGVRRAWMALRAPPELGGQPALHGVGQPEGDADVSLPMGERASHLFVAGTTGSGKTSVEDGFLVQDIRRGDAAVIAIDPKGRGDTVRLLHGEAERAGRPFVFFHLGFPELSAYYNPIGRFDRITEPATRLAHGLPGDGDAAAFRQFAWLFSNMVVRAQVMLDEPPTARSVLKYMTNVQPLLINYYRAWFAREADADWAVKVETLKAAQGRRARGNRPLDDGDREARALVDYAQTTDLYDSVAEGLRRAWDFDRDFYARISLAIQPLLEKLLSGGIADIINPQFASPEAAKRPTLDIESAIRQRAIVYIGLDALTDAEIATVVGQAFVSDMVAYSGHMQKHGIYDGLPFGGDKPTVYVHMDEFSDLVRGPEMNQALGKAREAGFRFTLYSQSMADVEAGLGNAAKAEQLLGNATKTVMMLNVASQATAEIVTQRLDEVEVNALMLESGTVDSADPASGTEFVSSTRERLSTQTVPLLSPGHLMKLPVGGAFVLKEGGRLFKLRVPFIDCSAYRLPPKLDAATRAMDARRASDPYWMRYTPSLNLAAFQQRGRVT